MILTQKYVRMRKDMVKSQSICYKFMLNLNEGKTYQGFAIVSFILQSQISSQQQFVIDFSSSNILSYKINQHSVHQIKRDGYLMKIDKVFLKYQPHVNILELCYQNAYDNDSNGLISFKDRQGQQYIYSIFEPYHTHRVFPVFDQPNLKATLQLTIITPNHWKNAISNQFPQKQEILSQDLLHQTFNEAKQSEFFKLISQKKDKALVTIFKKTKLLPPHVFCVNAGPYQYLELNSEPLNIPMRVFSSKTNFYLLVKMKQILQELTVKAMQFFNSFTGYQYPFCKYDQIFPGQYERVAMENASSSIFTDQYLHDPELLSHQKRFWMVNTLVHELAHHWFGNILTAQWWEDLWIHEGFAEFFGFYCPYKIKEDVKYLDLQDSMAYFLQTKQMGFNADNSRTSRAVYEKNQTISKAFANFEGIGISYTKGASILFQLFSIIGQQSFSKFLKKLFESFAFKNITVQKFIIAAEPYFPQTYMGQTLFKWAQNWLRTSSYNILSYKKKPQSKSLSIIQQPDRNKLLRVHKIKIAFVTPQLQIIVHQHKIEASEQTIIQVPFAFEALIVNYEGYSYARLDIDNNSLQFMLENYEKIRNNMIKTHLWTWLFSQIKQEKISVKYLVDVIMEKMRKQESDCILQMCLKQLSYVISNENNEKIQDELSSQLFKFIISLVQNALSKNRMLIISEYLPAFAYNINAIGILQSWLKGKNISLKNIPMSYDTMWTILQKKYQYGDRSPQAKQLKDYILVQDQSDRSILRIIQINAMLSSQQQILEIYQSFIAEQCEQSVSHKKVKARGWSSSPHKNQLYKCHKMFAADVEKMSRKLKHEHFDFFINHLYPTNFTNSKDIEELKAIKLQGDQFYKQRVDLLNLFEENYSSYM